MIFSPIHLDDNKEYLFICVLPHNMQDVLQHY